MLSVYYFGAFWSLLPRLERGLLPIFCGIRRAAPLRHDAFVRIRSLLCRACLDDATRSCPRVTLGDPVHATTFTAT
jgi:hypothetical protein